MSKAKALELDPGLSCSQTGSDFTVYNHAGRYVASGQSARDAWANALRSLEKRAARNGKAKTEELKPEPIPAPPDFAGLRKSDPVGIQIGEHRYATVDDAREVLRNCLRNAEIEADRYRRALAILEGNDHGEPTP